MRIIAVLALLLSLLACVPVSQHPVTPADPTTMDERLYGVWYWSEPDEYGYVHIGKDWKTGLLRMVMVDHRPDGRVSSDEYQGHSSSVSGRHYLNLKERKDGKLDEDYLIVKYRIDDKGLGVSMMNLEQFRQDIEQGVLPGKVTDTIDRTTADSKTLQAYLQKNDQLLFPDIAYLKRLPRPEPTGPTETALHND